MRVARGCLLPLGQSVKAKSGWVIDDTGASASFVLAIPQRIPRPLLFKEHPIYEQLAARTTNEQQERRSCIGSRQPLKLNSWALATAAPALGLNSGGAFASTSAHVWATHAAFRLSGQTFAPDGSDALRNLAPRQSLQWSGLDLLPA